MAVKPIPDQYHSLQPYLLVEGAPRLIEFLRATFDAEDLGSMPTPEGKIGHAEVRVGDTIVMLADASTAEGVSGPMPATVVAYVEDLRHGVPAGTRGGSDVAPRAGRHVLRRSQRRRRRSAREPLVDSHAHRGRIRGRGDAARPGATGLLGVPATGQPCPQHLSRRRARRLRARRGSRRGHRALDSDIGSSRPRTGWSRPWAARGRLRPPGKCPRQALRRGSSLGGATRGCTRSHRNGVRRERSVARSEPVLSELGTREKPDDLPNLGTVGEDQSGSHPAEDRAAVRGVYGREAEGVGGPAHGARRQGLGAEAREVE